MQMSVAIGPYGSYDPVETPKPLWGSPGAELSTWTTFQFCCETAIHGHALRHGPPELYSYTSLYSAIHYTAIHRYTLYNLYNTPLGVDPGHVGPGAKQCMPITIFSYHSGIRDAYITFIVFSG